MRLPARGRDGGIFGTAETVRYQIHIGKGLRGQERARHTSNEPSGQECARYTSKGLRGQECARYTSKGLRGQECPRYTSKRTFSDRNNLNRRAGCGIL